MNKVKEKQKDLDKETKKRLERLKLEMDAKKDFKLTMFENTENYDQIIIMKDIQAVARCEHHHCEFQVNVSVGYIPKEWLAGASKLIRIVETFFNLGEKTLQERGTQQILNLFMELKPKGVMVIVRGKHSCIKYRGVHSDSTMITSAISGVFEKDIAARQEFLALIKC